MSADVPRGEIPLGNIVSLGFSHNNLGHLPISREIVPNAAILMNHPRKTIFPRISMPFPRVLGPRETGGFH